MRTEGARISILARASCSGPDTLQQTVKDQLAQIYLQTGGGPYIREALAELPVIYVTGHTVNREAAVPGCVFLNKPYRTSAITEPSAR
jgi:hypothetical protein